MCRRGCIGSIDADLPRNGPPSTSSSSPRQHRAAAVAVGGLFVASSAGGVYAGSSDPPFTERSVPRPISPYGRQSWNTSVSATLWGEAHGIPVLIGRIANLYGPGQDMSKAQGLVSQLALTASAEADHALCSARHNARLHLCSRLCADDCTRARPSRRQRPRSRQSPRSSPRDAGSPSRRCWPSCAASSDASPASRWPRRHWPASRHVICASALRSGAISTPPRARHSLLVCMPSSKTLHTSSSEEILTVASPR